MEIGVVSPKTYNCRNGGRSRGVGGAGTGAASFVSRPEVVPVQFATAGTQLNIIEAH